MIPENCPSLEYLKIDDTYFIWFEKSGSFVLFKEPAWKVLYLFKKGRIKKEITEVFLRKHSSYGDNIQQFVNEIITIINNLNQPQKAALQRENTHVETCNKAPIHSKYIYKLNGRHLTIIYSNYRMEHAVHPLFAHLISDGIPKEENVLEVKETKKNLMLQFNSRLIKSVKKNDMDTFKGAVLQQIYSFLYGYKFNDWMMILHASGIIKNKQALIFTGESGSGKSTLAAILKAHGFNVISDDFLAVNSNGNACPFPAAISVKKGAAETLSLYYPWLINQSAQKAITGKTVKYIPLPSENLIPVPIKAIVFVTYNKSATELKPVSIKSGILKLMKETWIQPEQANVQKFFKWLKDAKFYRLSYNDNKQAVEFIHKIYSA
ncbi:MAG: hypothetical protein ACOCVA_02360 [Prolixibacteraceae bacterium]